MNNKDVTSTAFNAHQFAMCYPLGIEHHWWNKARSAFIANLVSTEYHEGDVFLEVGCGRGQEVQALRKTGINVLGVELAEVEPLKGLEPFIESGTEATQLSFALRSQVSGILLLDVIEHLPDPLAFLKTLEMSFPNLAVVIIAVPASPEIWSNYDVFYGHYRRYSTKMLWDLGIGLGWEHKKSGYFFHLLYIPARFLSLIGADRQTEIRAPGRMWRWFHRVISVVNRLDNALLPAQMRGTSAFSVFKLKS
jgi:SAM-dependent methyltransferase